MLGDFGKYIILLITIQCVCSETTHCDGTLLRSLSLRAICDTQDRFVECPEKILPGTMIHLNCAFGYTRNPKTAQMLQCLPDGSFDKSLDRCEQICGRIALTSTTLSKDGIEIESSIAPWHVAVYENDGVAYNYKCSGSIISPTLIISAASCFWDEKNLLPKNSTDFKIIAGRNMSNYTTEQNLYSQLVKVQQIHIPIEYQGNEQRQGNDIAFLRLESPLKYSETVAPICLPRELRDFGRGRMLTSQTFFINSFGTQNQLGRIEMTLYHDCVNKSHPNAPAAVDKFCIYNTEGGLVCSGDRGGGYYFKSNDFETNEIVYRLSGVVSNTPSARNDCKRTGENAYVVITNIIKTASEFKRKLTIARKDDEALF